MTERRSQLSDLWTMWGTCSMWIKLLLSGFPLLSGRKCWMSFSQAIEIAYKCLNQVAFSMKSCVRQVSGRLLKRRTDWWRPLGGQAECGRLSASVTTRPPFDARWTCASSSIWGLPCNCVADSGCLFSHMNTLAFLPPQRRCLKELPSLEWPGGMRLICLS